MHIMVVDPNEAFATLLSEELKRQGYDVARCFSAEEAITSAKKRMPDLALLDMALEAPDAIVLGQQMRDIEPHVRLMLIPLMGEQLSPEQAAISVQGVLPKPFFLPELPERIEAALQVPVDEGMKANVAEVTEPAADTESESDADFDAEFELLFAPEPESATSEPVMEFDLDAELELEPEPEPAPSPEPLPEPAPELAPQSEAADLPAPVGSDAEEGLSYAAFTKNRARVESSMDALAQEIGADAVLLTFGGGLLTWVGGLARNEAESISRAVIHGWRTSAEVSRILGREQSRFEQSITGGDYTLYALSVEVNAIMAVVVRGAAPLGLLRHHARSTVDKVARLCGR